ncbi:MAG: TetR/AcrR family transcriptional regulator [Myxococcota bacterium]
MSPEPVTTAQGDERRREILRHAVDVFGEAGFGGARIDEVAERVGIRRPSVLYHFPDKRSLYKAAMGDLLADIVARVTATESDDRDRLEAITDAWIDFVLARPNGARVLLRQMIDAEPIPMPELGAAVQIVLTVIQASIEDRMGSDGGKAVDVTEFVLILSSTSLVWVTSRSAIEGAFGLDTLSAPSIQRHRRILHALTNQLLTATTDAVPRTAERGAAPRAGKKVPSPRGIRRAKR